MKPKLGDIFEYVDGSCFLMGENDICYRISFNHEWELTVSGKPFEFSEKEFLFNVFDVMSKILGGKYATKN